MVPIFGVISQVIKWWLRYFRWSGAPVPPAEDRRVRHHAPPPGQQVVQSLLRSAGQVSSTHRNKHSVVYQDLLSSIPRSVSLLWWSVHSRCDWSSDWSLVVDPFSCFSFHLVLHCWCTKSRGMCCPVCGIVHIKELVADRKVLPMWTPTK